MSCGVVCDFCSHNLAPQPQIIQPHLITCLAGFYNLATKRPTSFPTLWVVHYAINEPLLGTTYVWCIRSQGKATFHIRSVNFSITEPSTFAGLFEFVASDIRLKHNYRVLTGQS